MRGALFWLLMLLAVLAVGGFHLAGDGDWLDTDITHLMPAEHQDPVVARALQQDRLGVAGELMLLVTGPTVAAEAAMRAARDELEAAAVARPVRSGSSRDLLDHLADWRFVLLSDTRLEAMRADPAQAYLRAVQARLARPSSTPGLGFDKDPAGFLGDYLSRLPNPYPGLQARGGLWQGERAGEPFWFLPMTLQGEAFDGRFQATVLDALENARLAASAECGDCRLQVTGPVLFAAEQRDLARAEITLISTLSLSGIVLLVLLAFGSLRPVLLGTLALATGVLMAVALSLLLFGRLHVITLVAGTTLLGIAIDYVFKYLVHRAEGDSPGGGADVVRRLRRPLVLGVASSLLCLTVLALSPFPVMRELAVFSGAGLAGAWLTVVWLFPFADRGRPLQLRSRLQQGVNRPVAFFAGLGRVRWLLPLLCLPLGVLAYALIPGSDDLRAFQAELPERLAVDQHLRSLTGTNFPEGFFIVEGDAADTVLEREQALLSRLDQGLADAPIALSRVVPPLTRQKEAHALIGQALNNPRLMEQLQALGLSSAGLQRLRRDWAAADGRWLQPRDLGSGPLAPLADSLWLKHETAPASLVIPRGAPGIESALPPGVRFIRPISLMNENLSAQRRAAGHWILTAAVLGIPLLFVLILGWPRGLRPALAPLCALSITLLFLWLSGIGLNTFVLMGLILGLGVGADYAAFLAAEQRVSPPGVTGIALAAVTTLLAFGLLGLSQVSALGQFGLTVVVGIVAAWLSSFVLACEDGGEGVA
ncbi:MMPL family transporter [Natronospira bacteriovora]|uniref:Exporter n=1 Tax=Natronospira bacteriovora TaxID=3069753 RepID=A0ABU0W7I1_9GAMM|nr:hypothetical protein [Natronospira sp. AB-CW4]MDQ2069986.1 hypothetical protein [Natronospira sp. AB-CW4]